MVAGFKILNTADDPAPGTPFALPDQVDYDMLHLGIQQNGVLTGCAVTGSGTTTVAVAAGTVQIAGLSVTVASGNVAITSGHATLNRLDLIVVDNTGAKSAVAGTPAAGQAVEFPDIPANSVVLAAVWQPAAGTNIAANQVVDKRLFVGHGAAHAPGGGDSLSAYYSGRTLDEIETQATFLFDGTGGQVAGTFADITGAATAGSGFTVNDKPIEFLLDAVYALKNGGTKFTGNVQLTIIMVCTAAPTAGDVGLVVAVAQVKHDQVTASNTAANNAFRVDKTVARKIMLVGNGGFGANQIKAGSGYKFKLQMTLSTVTNIAAQVAQPTITGGTVAPAVLATSREV